VRAPRPPHTRHLRALRLALLGVLLVGGAARAEPAPVVEYLTATANEAGAAGGHAALRLGARVFHFEADAGHLRLAREPWSDFRFRYRVLENRTLHAQRIGVAPGTAADLRRHFDRRLWIEAAERARLDALARDVHLLEALAGEADAGLAVPGAGFFAGTGAAVDAEGAGSAAVRALTRRIARERGPDFVAARLRETRAALAALSPEPVGASPRAGPVPTGATLSERYLEHRAAVRALEVLRDAPPLRADALAALPPDVPALSPAETRALRARSEALETRLVRLAGSQRPDWGAAFALGTARLAALAETLERGRLVVLDALPAGAHRVDADTVQRAAAPLRERLERHRAALVRARRALLGASEGERALNALEVAASRTAELARALRERRPLRVAPGPLVPRGAAQVAPLLAPDFVAAGTRAPLAAARARLRTAREAHAARHGYDLVANNCVTAIFREVRAATDARLALASGGGPVARGLHAARFVPFVSASLVARSWPVVGERTLPSYRHEQLARLDERAPGWLVHLRESNTLTATLYEPNSVDSVFVFFTDTTTWSRPLLGALNLAAGVVHGAAGLLRLPWDGGHHLARAARGVAASLPELVFVNVRKGSYPFAAPLWAAEGGAAGRGAPSGPRR